MRNLSSQAAQVLENEAWLESFKQLYESLHAQWASTAHEEWRKREMLYERIQALQDVRMKLETLMATGALS